VPDDEWWVSVDLETTGTDPSHAAVIQIGAVKFNPRRREIDPDTFDRCLDVPPNRFWDTATRAWWGRQGRVLYDIQTRMEPPGRVIEDFYRWLGGADCALCLYAKPTSFERPFLESYFREHGFPCPLDFRRERDLRSFLAGLAFPGKAFDDRSVPFDGVPHNALFDALHQVKILFRALEERCSSNSSTGSAG
jgi:DNA polymerase III epsilon subunit-like protein